MYYLFLYIEKGSVDTLTGLLNRESYYRDIKDMHNTIRGVVLFDMNRLNELNDEYGYDEGDKALVIISEVINKYTYFKIKHIHNVFDIAEKLIDLNINYDNVPLKETLRYTLSNKKFYSKEIFITNSGKTSIMKYVNPDF